jgi:hypothetical protein
MIVGSGLLARGFAPYFGESERHCVYAAGVSNSMSTDQREFDREEQRLRLALADHRSADVFIYFGTCAANARDAPSTPYIAHKLRMETIARTHPSYLILRLPQVAGHTTNPHTLLNFLFDRISRGERFPVWTRARRNIIDIEDAAQIGAALAIGEAIRRDCIDVANVSDVLAADIVHVMATVVGKEAVCDLVDRGDHYPIDTSRAHAAMDRSGVAFGAGYLERVIRKYYSNMATAQGLGPAMEAPR